jgi:hypothetical protein
MGHDLLRRQVGIAAVDLRRPGSPTPSPRRLRGGHPRRPLGYLESLASSTRGATRRPALDEDGKPVRGEDGTVQQRVETWPINTRGYLAAWFTEFTSREDDPQLHTHVVVANRVKGVDGHWRALDGQLLYRHQKDASYLHEAELRRQLTQRLGVRCSRYARAWLTSTGSPASRSRSPPCAGNRSSPGSKPRSCRHRLRPAKRRPWPPAKPAIVPSRR